MTLLSPPPLSTNNNSSTQERGRRVPTVVPAQETVLNCTLSDSQKTVEMQNITKPQIFSKDFAMEPEMLQTYTKNRSQTHHYIDSYKDPPSWDFGGSMSQLSYSTTADPIAV
ncbi:uncharacterized protein BKCO1_1800092 [Diplodia corticola]|uniref:Uncharacterized protein n=1 Tax=Diplodia corticola TaxID=236234 RepID=A0A1J9S5N1_9PEZI|nr:uncharacterized protein BKCO1_1800092 [Diplodia corticola]OJD35252.1 hypothetical protein BKCO1_1800092 [Diplodia corticola]